MQIYTRTGDKGYTRIIGGMQVAKDSERVTAYGTVDELNSIVGMAASSDEATPALREELMTIQQYLFDCGNDLATPHGKNPYRVHKELTLWLESRIDEYADVPPVVESFILPGGTKLASQLHFARTVARRAEREIVTFMWTNDMNEEVVRFVNRLSDYFFAVARVVNAEANVQDVLYERSGRVFHTEITKADLKD
ncbi:cob(I)alamin adenosyltransferase [Trichococcus flocculiformis]|uniref:cob(I)yrinic acid a,c-diamide adenosyltransferase n=1 Tax=Carnobacteriaceae TaxID=186828 RepID=UPI0007A8F53F|nr:MULTISPECIES: cob(I)yrinic acid a,c-diamide adenosyltransferase [Carnobacteriaceae]MDE1548764.1 cob(I)yrinic acid a,c-diamide adenosyltransferase [Jeotgalibaca caeni]CZR08941.1 cobalamin adenosyltransferase [Trichococcus sp. ES5]SHG08816.1 cob(I)alamin adenosyltransferase [Trichococcus flocculiformis]